MKIVVVGGTGQVGSRLVPVLRAKGHDVLVAAQSTGVDVVTGAGVKEALDGAEVVVDVLGSPTFVDDEVMEFFTTTTRNLLDAEAATGVRHHVALSIVGADRLPDGGYLRAKVAQESLIEKGDVPYTIVRATQFFEFLPLIADILTADGEVRAPSGRLQPMAVSDVAALVADSAVALPVNGRVDIAGPEAIPLHELLRRVLTSVGDARSVVRDDDVRYFGARLTDDSLIPHGNARIGKIEFAEWLTVRS